MQVWTATSGRAVRLNARINLPAKILTDNCYNGILRIEHLSMEVTRSPHPSGPIKTSLEYIMLDEHFPAIGQYTMQSRQTGELDYVWQVVTPDVGCKLQGIYEYGPCV
jgi:hypothetical protein